MKKFCEGAGVRWREPEEVDLIMKDTVENSEYCGLSTIVEMMFEINLAPNTQAGGVGTDNMTCIIIEFRDKGDDKVTPPVKNKKRKIKKEEKPKPPADAKKSVSESP
jgi:hypothetical protein